MSFSSSFYVGTWKRLCQGVCLYIHICEQNVRACIKSRTGRQDVTHSATTKPSNIYIPKQASFPSWIGCIRVSPVWPLQRAVSAKHGAGSKHGPDTAESFTICLYQDKNKVLGHTVSPRWRWQIYGWPTDVQAAAAAVTNNEDGRRRDRRKRFLPVLHTGKVYHSLSRQSP